MSEQPRPPISLAIGVTGHRDLVDVELPVLRARIAELLDYMAREFPGLPLQGLSSLAEGADRLFAEVALERGIPLVAVLPMPVAEYEQDFTAAASRAKFHELLGQSEVMELAAPKGLPPAGTETGRQGRYAAAGVFIASHCQVLVALWDGKPPIHRGGTADIVSYRITGYLPGSDPEGIGPEDLLADNENDLVYHIACSRAQPDGSPVAGRVPGEVGWLTDDPYEPRTSDLPLHYRNIFNHMQSFAGECLQHRTAIAQHGRSLLENRPFPPAVEHVDQLFATADWLANIYQKRVSRSLRTLYTLGFFMGLAFVLYSDLYPARWVLWAFLALFATGVYLHRQAERGAWHRRYLDYRALAEGLRVQVYWSMAGLSSPGGGRFAHDVFLQKQDVELSWIRHVMRNAAITSDADPAGVRPPSPDGVEFAIREWVGRPDSGQIGYYANRALQRSRRNVLTERVGRIALCTGIGVAGVLAVIAARLPEIWHDILLFSVGALTLSAAVREAYAFRTADKELVKQYRFMHRIFSNARRRLDTASNDAERRGILRALGDAALDEHTEWILMHRERPPEHGKL
ncbi:hypothetical protein [Thioalkalivibrio sp. XN279]|uniref:hypothetical protein n=1 Tax=Thioalkalivibrio sp. XN279 TaxID=2714953 RepID=UPI00140A19FF|nr:hypothetical protein [Thioalkalivibrio sp. XN279]NHA13445.1 hypothetical protein [Thioalkalivibrio sp. XN279]